jgi:hypothetical protein
MNNSLILILISIVLFTYFGGQYIPRVLKVNKHWLAAFVIGFIFCSLFHGYEGINFPNLPKIHLSDLPGPAGRLGSKFDNAVGAKKKMATDIATNAVNKFSDKIDGHNSSDTAAMEMVLKQMKQMEQDVKKAQSGTCGKPGETVKNGVYKDKPCGLAYERVIDPDGGDPALAGPGKWCGKGGVAIQGCTWVEGSAEEDNFADRLKENNFADRLKENNFADRLKASAKRQPLEDNCPISCVVGGNVNPCPSGCIAP